jgi:hypothetical protein
MSQEGLSSGEGWSMPSGTNELKRNHTKKKGRIAGYEDLMVDEGEEDNFIGFARHSGRKLAQKTGEDGLQFLVVAHLTSRN